MPVSHRLVTLVAAVALALAAHATAAAPPNSDSLLWRVESDKQSEPSYIFGTMHSDREAVVELATKVERAFEDAERYAFELDFGADIRAKIAQQMLVPSGSSLEKRLGSKTWSQLKEQARARGLPPSGLSQFEPWAVAMTLAQPKIQPQKALDWVLYRRANERDAPTTGLETVGEQMSVFEDIPEDKQIELLEKVVELRASGELASLHAASVEAWLEEDLARLVDMMENNPMMPDPASQATLQKRLVTERNTRMAERMQSLLDQGGAFVAIGALHLPGEQGVIAQLRDAGYELSAVR